ncbi:hypothetical protein [Shinella sp.]|uniref:hypothetical protein n=1 Tax=Shinella sp. TaxID=1870904 RepID=UPI00301D2802
MKIDGSMLSAHALGRPRAATGGDSLSSGMGESGGAWKRNIPTVETSAAMPSGLANALWVNRQEKAERESDGILSDFMELSKMTPVERLRKELLESMGLTEESLADLPPEAREAIEEEIRRTVKERLGIDDTREAGNAAGQSAAGNDEAKA